MVRKVISYGGGVGSTGLICYLYNEIDEYEIVFVDHGGDYPETYNYVKYISSKLDIDINIIKPEIQLYDNMILKERIPMINYRICTGESKIQPFNRYLKGKAEVYIGITYDEKKRAKENKLKRLISKYPLVCEEITRKDCENIIKAQGIKVPMRSGCYFCPFQSKNQWFNLYNTHNDLFEKAIYMEQNAQKNRKNAALLPSGRTLQSLKKDFEEQQKLF